MRLARRVYEASRVQQLRFQGAYVGGGVDEVRGGLPDGCLARASGGHCTLASCPCDP